MLMLSVSSLFLAGKTNSVSQQWRFGLDTVVCVTHIHASMVMAFTQYLPLKLHLNL